MILIPGEFKKIMIIVMMKRIIKNLNLVMSKSLEVCRDAHGANVLQCLALKC